MKKIKVIFYGVGAIGSEVAKFGLTRPWLEVVGAVDSDPAKIGRDLGAVLGPQDYAARTSLSGAAFHRELLPS